MKMNYYPSGKSNDRVEFFWGEIAPSEHIVEIYEGHEPFMDSLEGFVVGGLQKTDSVILIVKPTHLEALEDRMRERNLDLEALRAQDRYITYDAEEILSKFMVNGWPNEELFMQTITPILDRAKKSGRRVRAFGEMVALLWAEGNSGATVHLEHIWHNLCKKDGLSLFCAYPKAGFTGDVVDSIQAICDSHSKVYANYN